MRDPSRAEVASEPAELAGRRWVFGPAVLDERSLELAVSGQQVKLERKPLEVLLYLLHHAGEVVTKDDLAESLWPGRILTETVLTRCISLLRTALQDDARTLIRTVHGFGYRLVADVRIDASAPTAARPAFDFRPGDHPPLRPQWKLVERLGTGGHGEAWLARHDKTGDARVFKFALDAGALTSLKREITLYRLLRDSLGERTRVARIFEWNLAEPPYFIEMEHVAGGNLQAWCEAQGGISAVPLPARLQLVAQIADALAAAHSVGALHKDLKPGNVLIHVENGAPVIRLCDFGSGGVLDPQRLDALGITRQGFTKTITEGATSGTPLYIAPEVIAGQPFTVQADVYSLGVLLYQVVAGDLRKALAPGWESDVEDELLREDIALAAAGNPAKRLTDAAQLGERLRGLEARREARAGEVATQQRTERAHRALQELRRVRVYAGVLLALTAIAAAGGISAYRARNEAVAATATAEAVSGFLMEDVLRVDTGVFTSSDASYEALLNGAAAEVAARLGDQPKAAARIYWLLGRRYQEIARFKVAAQQYERAVALFTDLYGRADDSTLMALDRLAWVYMEDGRVTEALEVSEQMRSASESRLHPDDLAMLMIRVRIARMLIVTGDYAAAESELRAVVLLGATANPTNEHVMFLFSQWLGITPPTDGARDVVIAYANTLLASGVLEEVGEEHSEAESLLRASLATFSGVLGNENELSAVASMALAVILASAGQYQEAEEFASRSRQFFDKALPARHFARAVPRMAMGRVRLEQRRFAESAEVLREAVDFCSLDSGCPPRVRAEFLWDLGQALSEMGDGPGAVGALGESVQLLEKRGVVNRLLLLRSRVGLVDALRLAGRVDEGRAVMSTVEQEGIPRLRPYQQARADLYRAQGLLLLKDGEFDRARLALNDSLKIVDRRLGPAHWRTVRARSELAAANPPAGSQSH
jgi:DNA-binding winged helix-turn-helix (wHTH) protein/tetratricopeptide (TPR) repeat protein